jgi:hypothetical protein
MQKLAAIVFIGNEDIIRNSSMNWFDSSTSGGAALFTQVKRFFCFKNFPNSSENKDLIGSISD